MASNTFFPNLTDLPKPIRNDILCMLCCNILECPIDVEGALPLIGYRSNLMTQYYGDSTISPN